MLALLSAAALICSAVPYTHSAEIYRCPNDWVHFEDFCYAFLDDIAPWSTALVMCQQLDSSLLVIKNDRENDFIAAQLSARHGNNKTNIYWMNIHDLVLEGHWVQGENQPLAFARWRAATAEPNNDMRFENGEDCATILSDGTWNDLWCQDYDRETHSPRPVCKKRITVP